MPKLSFREYPDNKRFVVELGDDFVGVVRTYDGKDWHIEQIGSHDEGWDVSLIGRFPDRDVAANFIYVLRNRVESIRAATPLPANVMEYINRRAKDLLDQKRRIEAEMIDLQSERYHLFRLAKQYGIKSAERLSDDADTPGIIESLLTFEVEKGKKTVPFFSEVYLYPLLGKDNARSLLGLLRSLLQNIAPDKASNL